MEAAHETPRERPFLAAQPGAEIIQLLATRCPACAAMMFPPQPACGRCGHEGVDDVPVGPRGTLWSYTVQTFRPPSPPYGVEDAEAFGDYGVGMIKLDGGLLVHARLTESDGARLAIGQAFEAVPQVLPRVGGGVIETYAFRPVAEEAAR